MAKPLYSINNFCTSAAHTKTHNPQASREEGHEARKDIGREGVLGWLLPHLIVRLLIMRFIALVKLFSSSSTTAEVKYSAVAEETLRIN